LRPDISLNRQRKGKIMHTIENSVGQQFGQQIRSASREILSLGVDMDGRGLHWRLAKHTAPLGRLEFALAVYRTGGLYVLIHADRGFLCVERIAQKAARLGIARANESYSIGHAFAELYDALGFEYGSTVGFALIEGTDLACPEGFIKGFSDSVAQSVEGDVMNVIRGSKTAGQEILINNLRNYICNYLKANTPATTLFRRLT